jgi:hypothetical protein
MNTLETRSKMRFGLQGPRLGMHFVCLLLFVGWALTVSHLYGVGNTLELLAVVTTVLILMRVLTGKRTRRLAR